MLKNKGELLNPLFFYFNIKSIPTLVLLKDGQFIHRLTGFKPKNIIKDLISKGKI